jgi:SAM-dependent methyltransferase
MSNMNNKHNAKRSGAKRRPDYVPAGPQEAFIVPVLKKAIESRLKALASSAGGAKGRRLRVLDVGCGSKPFRHFFEEPRFDYYSFDVQAQADDSLDFIGPLDAELPGQLVEAEPFDFILCTEVLEHVADWDKAYRNFALLLAPNGEILLTAPHFYPLHEEPYDFWRPTRYAFAYFAERHGLEVQDFEALGDSFDVLGTLLAKQNIRAREHLCFWDRQYAKVVRFAQEKLRKLLISRYLQNHVVDHGSLYISNLVILKNSNGAADCCLKKGFS